MLAHALLVVIAFGQAYEGTAYGDPSYVQRHVAVKEQLSAAIDASRSARAAKRKEIQPTIDRLKAELEEIILKESPVPTGMDGVHVMTPRTFFIGAIGRLGTCEVAQITGPDEMHVTGYGSRRYILKGINTSGYVDDQRLALPGLWKVTGTESYSNVMGGNTTVFVLTQASATETEVYMSGIVRSKPSKQPYQFPWKDPKGKVLLTGEFVKLDKTNAIFVVDGEEKQLAISRLSTGDREVVRWLATLK